VYHFKKGENTMSLLLSLLAIYIIIALADIAIGIYIIREILDANWLDYILFGSVTLTISLCPITNIIFLIWFIVERNRLRDI